MFPSSCREKKENSCTTAATTPAQVAATPTPAQPAATTTHPLVAIVTTATHPTIASSLLTLTHLLLL